MAENGQAGATFHGPDQFQQRVIDSRERSIRVLAPAGSGKTETLGRRIRARITAGILPARILVLTFDRNANAAFLATLDRLDVRPRPEVRTLNAFGLKVLRQDFPDERANVRSRFYAPEQPMLASLVDETDHAALMDLFSVVKSHLFDPRAIDRKGLASWIEQRYERLLPQRFVESYPAARSAKTLAREFAQEFARYETFLQDARAIDFDDQKLRAWVCLRDHPEIAGRIRQQYDEIIVDEFQDINELDAALIRQIATDATLVITGDDDQAIYGFRWASPTYLIQPDTLFGRQFTSYELQVNYRCPPVILDHATALIRHNRTRVPKTPASGAGVSGSIEQIVKQDRIAEANAIRLRIIELLREDRTLTFSDVAVLYRRNEQHYPVQVQLFRSGIPYRVAEGFDMRLQWRVALDLLDLSTALRSSARRVDLDLRPAVRAFRGFRYVPEAARQGLLEIASTEGPFQLDLLISAAKEQAGDYQGRMFETAIRQLRTARSIAQELDVIESEFVGTARRRPGRRNQGSPGGDDDSALRVLKDVLGSRPTDRAGSIDRLRGFLAEGFARTLDLDGAVELSTCHGAKGRQWPIVVLPSCNEGIVPDPLMRPEHGEEEGERRLLYVAMTRAARHLVIGHSATSKDPAPSRFLYEAELDGLPERMVPGTPGVSPARPAPAPARGGRKTGTSARPAGSGSKGRIRPEDVRVLSSGPLGGQPPTLGPSSRSSSPNSRNEVTKRPGSRSAFGTVRVVAIGGATEDIDPIDDATVTGTMVQAGSVSLGVHYRTVMLSYPLQFALMLVDIPYLIAHEDRLVESPTMHRLYTSLVGTAEDRAGQPVAPSVSGQETAIVAAMARQARARATTRTALKALLDRAIERASTPRTGSGSPRVAFRKTGAVE